MCTMNLNKREVKDIILMNSIIKKRKLTTPCKNRKTQKVYKTLYRNETTEQRLQNSI